MFDTSVPAGSKTILTAPSVWAASSAYRPAAEFDTRVSNAVSATWRARSSP